MESGLLFVIDKRSTVRDTYLEDCKDLFRGTSRLLGTVFQEKTENGRCIVWYIHIINGTKCMVVLDLMKVGCRSISE